MGAEEPSSSLVSSESSSEVQNLYQNYGSLQVRNLIGGNLQEFAEQFRGASKVLNKNSSYSQFWLRLSLSVNAKLSN